MKTFIYVVSSSFSHSIPSSLSLSHTHTHTYTYKVVVVPLSKNTFSDTVQHCFLDMINLQSYYYMYTY